jgi:hypothetical protein
LVRLRAACGTIVPGDDTDEKKNNQFTIDEQGGMIGAVQLLGHKRQRETTASLIATIVATAVTALQKG